MKSFQTYSELRKHLAPLFKANGFKRAKTMLSWVRPHRKLFLGAWCQVSQDGWDEYAGSKFVVEFQVGPESIIGRHTTRRERIGRLLNDSDRETIRTLQNDVIAKLTRPPWNYGLLHVSEDVRSWYLKQFELVERPYSQGDDIWFRYSRSDDVARWARFLITKLPEVFQQIETWV
ncbi:MAG: hypothetical protein ABSD44_14265 [Terracidiphilus sp.]